MHIQNYYLYPLHYSLIPCSEWLIPEAEWVWFYRYPASTEKVGRDCKQSTGGKPYCRTQLDFRSCYRAR